MSRRAGAAELQMRLRSADDAWTVSDRGHGAAAGESIFAVANGYLGVRGTLEEGGATYDPGVLVNGLHETWPIAYPEDAYGLARTGQTIVTAPDPSVVRLVVDGRPFDAATTRVVRSERALDLRAGVLVREVEWETEGGARLLLRSRRLASLADRHLVAIAYEVVALAGTADVRLSSELVTHRPPDGAEDPRRAKAFAAPVLAPVTAHATGARAVLELRTRRSGLTLACGMDHVVHGATCRPAIAVGDGAAVEVAAELQVGASLRLEKFAVYHWGTEAAGLTTAVDRGLDRAVAAGYDAVEAEHRAVVAGFWRSSDIELAGAPEHQRAVRFNLFALLQATGRADGAGVPAKGLTGRGYDGHYFWDTEIYVAPFLAHTSPDRARELLRMRCAMLPAARRRARELGHRGALYPWRTITGEEASAWYAAGTAQYHINADIAYAMLHYARVTGDIGFLVDEAAEVLVETARLWLDLGFFCERRSGAFSITAVTGPDEYSAVVDNNAYTNLMARENLEGAVGLVEWLERANPEAHDRLIAATGLAAGEVDDWRAAAERMYVPRDEDLGILMQDERFLDRKPWDFSRSAGDRPLLLDHHPLELYRHQVIKQTDAVLAAYLTGHRLSREEVRRTYDHYEPLTTGDSTLSACIQSVVASAAGHADAALEHFVEACAIDLADSHGNTADGLHIASCGGTWLALVAGFGGLRDFDGCLRLEPQLPARWERLRFRLQAHGQLLEVDLTHAAATYTLLEGTGLVLEHAGEVRRLVPGTPLRIPAPAALPQAA